MITVLVTVALVPTLPLSVPLAQAGNSSNGATSNPMPIRYR
jgi:hypothetical protein